MQQNKFQQEQLDLLKKLIESVNNLTKALTEVKKEIKSYNNENQRDNPLRIK